MKHDMVQTSVQSAMVLELLAETTGGEGCSLVSEKMALDIMDEEEDATTLADLSDCQLFLPSVLFNDVYALEAVWAAYGLTLAEIDWLQS
eukprot:1790132-Amphidinium_carterae.1